MHACRCAASAPSAPSAHRLRTRADTPAPALVLTRHPYAAALVESDLDVLLPPALGRSLHPPPHVESRRLHPTQILCLAWRCLGDFDEIRIGCLATGGQHSRSGYAGITAQGLSPRPAKPSRRTFLADRFTANCTIVRASRFGSVTRPKSIPATKVSPAPRVLHGLLVILVDFQSCAESAWPTYSFTGSPLLSGMEQLKHP